MNCPTVVSEGVALIVVATDTNERGVHHTNERGVHQVDTGIQSLEVWL